jgi:hypothetical protein
MSSATHRMSITNPDKIDTDEFQQIQSTGSIKDAKNCLRMASVFSSLWAFVGHVWDE